MSNRRTAGSAPKMVNHEPTVEVTREHIGHRKPVTGTVIALSGGAVE